MKRYFALLTGITVITASLFSCSKEIPAVAHATIPSGVAYLRIVHASPNWKKLTGKPDGLNIFLDSTKVNGPVLKYNTAYPGAGVNTYATVPTGTLNVRIEVGGVVNADSIPGVTFKETLAVGAYYTLIITDSITDASGNPRLFPITWNQDNFTVPQPGNLAFRLANAVLNSPDTVELYSKRRNVIIFPSMYRDTITPFLTLPNLTNQLDTFQIRNAVTKKVIGTASSIQLPDQGVYTLFYIGDTTAKIGTVLVGYQNR